MRIIDYIERLAGEHVDVRHNEDGLSHFMSSARGVHTAIDSVLHYPAVIVDRGGGYDFEGTPGHSFKRREYLLFVVDHVSDTSNYTEIDCALDKCERILDELLNRIWTERREHPEWHTVSLDGQSVDYIANYDNQQYGVVVRLEIPEPYAAINCREAFSDG